MIIVEFASNLVWVVAALSLLGMTYRGVRRGTVRLSMASAMTLAMLICLILLPAISISDDLLAARQAALPVSGQTWRMVSEAASSGLDKVLMVGLYLLLMMCFLIETRMTFQDQWAVRPLAARLARSQRLRPPPCAV
jgi:hypothetical protein